MDAGNGAAFTPAPVPPSRRRNRPSVASRTRAQPRRIRRDVAHVAEPVVPGDDRRGPFSAWASARAMSPTVRGVPEPTLKARTPDTCCLAGEHGRGRDVAHMHEVAALSAVLEHLRRFAAPQRRGEDRRHARIGRVARHAGAVDVVIAHRRDRAAGDARPVAGVELLRHLAARIGVARIERRVLADQRGRERRAAMRARRLELAGGERRFARGAGATAPCSAQCPTPSP